MVKIRRLPRRFGMAVAAVGLETRVYVVGIGRGVVVVDMAIRARLPEPGERRADPDIGGDVAGDAVGGLVRAGEREVDLAVVEGRIGPGGDRMAEHAIEIQFHLVVDRCRALVKIGRMAGDARAVHIGEVTVGMARFAGHLLVGAFEREIGVLRRDGQNLRRTGLLVGAAPEREQAQDKKAQAPVLIGAHMVTQDAQGVVSLKSKVVNWMKKAYLAAHTALDEALVSHV